MTNDSHSPSLQTPNNTRLRSMAITTSTALLPLSPKYPMTFYRSTSSNDCTTTAAVNLSRLRCRNTQYTQYTKQFNDMSALIYPQNQWSSYHQQMSKLKMSVESGGRYRRHKRTKSLDSNRKKSSLDDLQICGFDDNVEVYNQSWLILFAGQKPMITTVHIEIVSFLFLLFLVLFVCMVCFVWFVCLEQ